MTLYEILGVKPTAKPSEIKAAYRKLAQKHHPDKGGDLKLFQAVQNAFEVLIDVERRARYDQTGESTASQESSAEDLLQAMAQQNLCQLIVAMVQKFSTDLRNRPLKDMMLAEVGDQIGKVEADLKTFAKEREALLIVADRFTPKEGCTGQLSDLAKTILSSVDSKIATATQFKAVCGKMRQILEAHDYRADLMLPSEGTARHSFHSHVNMEELIRTMGGRTFR